jgi:energy-coupling factor transport system permease protein
MSYRRRNSPLHAARASVAAAYCLALAFAAVVLSSPIALGAVTVAVAAETGGQGLTVIVRFGELPLLGHTDITLESTAYGGVLGLRAVALILCGAVYTGAVDPDEVLRLFRRRSFRSALSASIATRMVPMLIRDSRRLAEAQRCRPGRPPSRLQLMRAATSGMLDRALDVAAALEVRGYGAARRPLPKRSPYSRHDLAFGASAVAVAALALVVRIADLTPFHAYPTLRLTADVGAIAASALLVLCALLPFADRRGIER